MDWLDLTVVAALGVLALWELLSAWTHFERAGLIRRRETRLSQAGPGPVRLQGVLSARVPVRSPVTEEACVYAAVRARQRGSEMPGILAIYWLLRMFVESIGAILFVALIPVYQQGKPRRRQRWLAEEAVLEADGARLPLDLSDADFLIGAEPVLRVDVPTMNEPATEHMLRRAGLPHGWSRQFGWEITEWRLPQGQPASVVGELVVAPSGERRLEQCLVLRGVDPARVARRESRKGLGRLLLAALAAAAALLLTWVALAP